MPIPWIIFFVASLALGQGASVPTQAQATAPQQRVSSNQGTISATQPVASQPNGTLPLPTAMSSQELDELLSLVTSNNTPEARKLGAKKLLATGAAAATDRLALVLKASPPDAAAQLAVCQAIGSAERPPAPLIDPLLNLLSSQLPELNGPVINALRRFEPDLVLERLQPLARDGDVPVETRLSAIAALAAMAEDIRAIGTLADLVSDGSSQIRLAALATLTQATGIAFPDEAAAVAWWKQRESFSQADWMPEIHARRLLESRRLQAERQLLTTRLTTAYRELYLHTPESDRPRKLLSFLIDELPEVRDLGLDLVNAAITDRRDVSLETRARLIEMISDPQPGLRLKVAQIIGDLRLANAVGRLIEATSMEADHRVRAALVDAIGRLGGTQAVPALAERLNDDVPSVAAHAAIALASIARSSTSEDQATVQSITAALTDRFTLIPTTEVDLREKFLDAMTRIGAEPFRSIFKEEMAADRSVRVRRAAITGLAAFADLSAADEVLPFLSAAEPEIRQAAVATLGKCGRRETDLAALSSRLDAKSESDPTVRQKAWESYLAIAERLPPQDHLRIAEQFAKLGDKIAQRQRLELLGALQASAQRFEQLKSKKADKRLDLLEALADAHMKLGEFAPAAACLTQAADLARGSANGSYAALAARSVAVLLVGHEDESAMQQIKDLLGPEGQENPSDKMLIAEAVLDEAKARAQAVADAATFTDATRLLDTTSHLAGRFGGDFESRMAAFRETARSNRTAAINALLASLGTDAQAEGKLLGFGTDVVLKHIHALLADPSPTSAPAPAVEDRLVQLAKHLAPQWAGYSLDDTTAQRAAALDSLKTHAEAAAARPPSAPTTVPAANRPTFSNN